MSRKIRLLITRTFLSIFSLTLGLAPVALAPLAYAEDATCTPDTSTQAGVTRPNGADAALYHYDCASGMWVSSHYTYNPNTGQITANDPVIYTYNPSTGMYDMQYWAYSAPLGDYVQTTQSVSAPPAGATVVGAPEPAAPAATNGGSGDQSISNTGDNSNNTIDNSGGAAGNASIDNTGASSNNTVGGSGNTVLETNNTNLLTIANLITQTATTGNAVVLQNTNAGNATSGNALDVATIMNLLQSSSNVLGTGNVVTFVKNIDGDVNGDLLFDPAMLSTVQPASLPSGNSDITFNNSTDASINNNINLAATSGDVVVSENTNAGNATSGSAEAIANVVNLINSAIGAGKSFVGTININGNLNGDILIPPSFIEQLIATNVPTVTISTTGAGSNNTVNNDSTNNANLTNTNNLGITNNVNTAAASGNATVTENTNAGSATSGDARTSITAFNLTGSNVIGANSILVFVNVLGTWVGLIVNAPPGATAAQLCGGGCTSSVGDTSGSNSIDGTNTNNLAINNNIRVAAKSGDAEVSRNTNAGNAKTGDAKAAVNLLNVQNSTFSLSNWFGILFINVFGSWHGSFGINTSAGDPIANEGSATGTSSGGSAPVPAQFFRFIPKTAGSGGSGGSGGTGTTFALAELPTGTGGRGADDSGNNKAVLAAQTVKNTGSPSSRPSLTTPHNSFGKTAAIITGCCLAYILMDALYTRRHPSRA